MSKPDETNGEDKIVDRLLLLAALGGLLLAALASLPGVNDPLLDNGVIARVNDRHIDRSEYARAYKALMDDKTKAPTAADRKLVLDRLIEEELLVQRGEEIGLIDGDASVRKAVAMSVIEFILAQSDKAPISELDLKNFYESNKDRFAPAARLQIERIFLRQMDAQGRKVLSDAQITRKLDSVRQALRSGEPFNKVAARMSDPILPELPRTMLVRSKMQDYLGPKLTAMAAQLPSGAITDAIADGAGWHFLRVVRNQPAKPPAYNNIQPQLKQALQRQRDDEALRTYLDWLRQRAAIDYADDAPQ